MGMVKYCKSNKWLGLYIHALARELAIVLEREVEEVVDNELQSQIFIDDTHVIDMRETLDCKKAWKDKVILKTQYSSNRSYPSNVKPYTYFELDIDLFQANLERYRKTERTETDLYFRGGLWFGRKKKLEALGLPIRKKIPVEEFYDELARQRLVFTCPSWANLCHREIECFGMGVPVIMPKLKVRTHDNLIPNIHYIAVDHWKEVREKEKQITDMQLQDVAGAAMEWYDKNVKFPNSINLTLDLF